MTAGNAALSVRPTASRFRPISTLMSVSNPATAPKTWRPPDSVSTLPMAMRDRPLADGRPDAPRDGFQTDRRLSPCVKIPRLMAFQTICFAGTRESPFIVESIRRKPYQTLDTELPPEFY